MLRTAGSAAALTAASYSRVLGANDRVQLGLIGCGGRGRHVMGVFVDTDRVEVPSVCDVWPERSAQAKQKAPNAKQFTDHRKMLDSMKQLDAVLIATPDHWHALTAIDALNAGKDVYVEKPLTLRIEEGPPIVKAARMNNRVCQVGMQQRSGQHYLQAKEEIVKAGKLGKVTLARTWWHGNGAHPMQVPEKYQTKPSDLEWGHYLGPVKWRDWDPPQYFNFRAYLDFGGGQVTDLFTHWIDVVHMFMEQDNPTAAVASGGVYHYKDGRTAPDTIAVLLEYPREWTATFEATLAPGLRARGWNWWEPMGAFHHPQPVHVYARGSWRKAHRSEVTAGPDNRPCRELPRLCPFAQASQRRCLHRTQVCPGISPGQHRLRAEKANTVRSGSRRNSAALRMLRWLIRRATAPGFTEPVDDEATSEPVCGKLAAPLVCPCPRSSVNTRISTRRACLRPSRVLLSAFGSSSPIPRTFIFRSGTLC